MAYSPPGYAPPGYRQQPVRRRRRWPLRLAITLVVLLALALGADRIAAAVAENIAARSIQNSQHLPQRPDVHIGGFPFLTQLASSSYPSVEIVAHDIPVGPSVRQLTLDSVTVHLHEVTTARHFQSVHADSATAAAGTSYAQLSRTLGLHVAYAGPGRIGGSVSVSVAGHPVTGTISAHVSASSSAGLRFSAVALNAGGVELPQVDQALGRAFATPIPLDGLPFQIRVTGLDVTRSGLVVHFAGTNLSYDND